MFDNHIIYHQAFEIMAFCKFKVCVFIIIINIFNSCSIVLINYDVKYHRKLLPHAVSYLIFLGKPCEHFIEKYACVFVIGALPHFELI